MTPAFDTLRASRALRDAGVDERQADAIVGIVQQSAALPDISELATKKDLEVLENRLKGEINEKLRQQLLAFLALNAALAGLVVAILRAFP